MADSLASLPRTRRAGSLPAFDRLAPPPPRLDVRLWIGARSAASDIVVELHGRGGWVARAAAEDLRRGYDLESTALTRLVAEIVLRPPDLRHLDAAFTALAGQQRGGCRCANPSSVASPRAAPTAVARSSSRSSSGTVTPSRRPVVPIAAANAARRGPAIAARCPWTARTSPRPRPRTGIRRAAGSSAASRCPTRTTSCPTSCWTCTRPGRWMPSRAPSSASSRTCVRPASRRPCASCSWACCCPPASSTASRDGWPSRASWPASCVRVGDRQWRERNPWLLMEDGFRIGAHVRAASGDRPSGHLPRPVRPRPDRAP